MRLVAPTGLLLALAACTSHERYLVDASQLEALAQQRAAGSPPKALAAVRQSDQKPVWLQTDALQLGSVAVAGGHEVSVEARARNRLIEAGSSLTWIGTALSLVGTAVFAIGRLKSSDVTQYAGGFTALAGEPFMWSGTVLWIVGALRRPYELRTLPPPTVNR